MLRGKIKADAKRALKGNYVKAVAITLLIIGIYLLILLFDSIFSMVSGVYGFSDIMLTPTYFFDDIIRVTPQAILAASCFCVIVFVLIQPLKRGEQRFYYRMLGGSCEAVSEVFFYFSAPAAFFKSLYLSVSLLLRKLLWLVAFLLLPAALGAGIYYLHSSRIFVFSQVALVFLWMAVVLLALFAAVAFCVFQSRYFLVCYLFAADPCAKVKGVFRKSIRLTRGRKIELFILDLSFLLYYISCILVLPLLYVTPYTNTTKAIYARIIIESARQEAGSDLAILSDPLEAFAKEKN